MPIAETTPFQPHYRLMVNTKQIGEEIIADVVKVSAINAILLRYLEKVT